MQFFYYCLFVAGIVAADQITKALVVAHIPLGGHMDFLPGFLDFTYLRNTGAAFSILSGQRTFFLILTAVFLAGVVWCVVKKKLPRPYLWILAVITGGAIGNLIDRTVNGFVIDMFELEFINFAVFNVADLFITFGAGALAIYALFFDKPKKDVPDDRTV